MTRHAKSQTPARWVPGICLVTALLLGGCGQTDGPRRYRVSGAVNYNRVPVPVGRIVFEPDTSQQNHGPGGGAVIRQGRFRTERGKGVVGGPYVVRITGSDGVPVEVPGEGINPNGKPLFREYVTRVTFPPQNTTHTFDIPRQKPLPE